MGIASSGIICKMSVSELPQEFGFAVADVCKLVTYIWLYGFEHMGTEFAELSPHYQTA